MTTEDFAAAPVSLAEVRAERSQRASDWTPRDVLVALLRDIDSGKVKADRLVVAYAEALEGGSTKTHFSMSVPGAHVALGLLERAKFLINTDA